MTIASLTQVCNNEKLGRGLGTRPYYDIMAMTLYSYLLYADNDSIGATF